MDQQDRDPLFLRQLRKRSRKPWFDRVFVPNRGNREHRPPRRLTPRRVSTHPKQIAGRIRSVTHPIPMLPTVRQRLSRRLRTGIHPESRDKGMTQPWFHVPNELGKRRSGFAVGHDTSNGQSHPDSARNYAAS